MVRDLRWHQDQAGAWDVLGSVSGGLALDIGGNQAQAAHVLAANFTKVVSFEPAAESFAILEAESEDNVECVNAAVSSFTGQVRLTECDYAISTGQLTTGTGLAWGNPVGHRMVPCVTLDDVVKMYGQPDFTKVDVEGHEIEVLKGWTGPRCPVLIEVHAAANEQPVRDLFGEPLRKLVHDPSVGRMAYAEHFWLTNVS